MHSIYTRTIKVFVMWGARRSEKKSEETDNKRARPIGPRMGNRVEVGPTVWLFERESAREWRTKKKNNLRSRPFFFFSRHLNSISLASHHFLPLASLFMPFNGGLSDSNLSFFESFYNKRKKNKQTVWILLLFCPFRRAKLISIIY